MHYQAGAWERAKTLLDQMMFYKKAHKTQSQFQIWQEGCASKLIQGNDMMRQKLDYMHHNPVKRGYVDEASYWRYSSAKNYAGECGIIAVETEF